MDVTVTSRDDDDTIVEKMLKGALVAVKLGNYKDATARFEDILELGTSNFTLLATIYMWYGRACRKMKNHKKALDFFDREKSLMQLICNHQGFSDSSRRLTDLALKMKDFARAKRTAEEFMDYVLKKNCEELVEQARILLVSVYLEGFSDKMENNPDERKKLLTVVDEQIVALKAVCGDAVKPHILMLEAKSLAFGNRLKDARIIYQKCIELSFETNDLETVHQAYYEMAMYADGGVSSHSIHDLRSAIIYSTTCGKQLTVARYKLELAQQLMLAKSFNEAFFLSLEALEIIKKEELSLLTPAFLIVSKCLSLLGKRKQAAYFIVLGSVLNVEQKLDSFHQQIDELMTLEKQETPEGTEVELAVDSSIDSCPNQIVANVVLKLEHTTTVEMWEIKVKDIIEEAKKKPEEKEKENEPLDFFDLICKMNGRMDDQRTELPASVFQRPISAASSRKTTKSNKFFPGLRVNISKLHDRIDKAALNKLLKRSKKSATSLNSTSTLSTQAEDTLSTMTANDSSLSK